MATPTFTPVAEPTSLVTPGAGRQPANLTADTAALAERGIDVYQEQYCGICHQLEAAGTAGVFGPTHDRFAQVAERRIRDARYTGEAATADEYVRESILDPQRHLVDGYEHTQHHMPAYTNLNETDLDALVQLLLQQK
jgi:mono/diheme cytochrome c family protein